MGSRRHPAILPTAGATYAVPLTDGRFGACRVIRHSSTEEEEVFGKRRSLVACCDWVGDAPPDMNEPRLTEIMRLTHGNWSGQLGLLWVARRPPDDFIALGELTLSNDDDLQSDVNGSWRAFRIQPLRLTS